MSTVDVEPQAELRVIETVPDAPVAEYPATRLSFRSYRKIASSVAVEEKSAVPATPDPSARSGVATW